MSGDDIKRQALELFCADVSVTDICARPEMPSRPTFYKWSKEGHLTGGIPWPEYRKQQKEQNRRAQREALLAIRNEQALDFLGELQAFIENDLMLEMMTKARSGEFDLTISDFEKIAKLYAALTNQSADKLEFASWFARQMFDIAIEIMDQQQFALFKNRAMLLEQEVQKKLLPMQKPESLTA